MADALDDVVHAARFQPGHLAQLLHDLFPVDGGVPAPRLSVNASSQVTSSSIRAHRSATIPPVTRTGTGSGAGAGSGTGSVRRSLPASESTDAPANLTLEPRSKWKGAAATALVLAAGGFFVWKGVLRKKVDDDGAHVAAVSDPSKRFHVFVKSEPPGAQIFIEGEDMPIGETPVVVPIDLTGKNSLKLILRKEGFEDFDSRVINEMPLSINLRKKDASPEVPKAPAPSEPKLPALNPSEPGEASIAASTESSDKSGHVHHHGAPAAKKPPKPPPAVPTEVEE